MRDRGRLRKGEGENQKEIKKKKRNTERGGEKE